MVQKAAPYLIDVMTDPQIKNSEETNHTILHKAFHTDLDTFAYLNTPERSLERRQTGKSLAAGAKSQPASSVLSGTQMATFSRLAY